MNQNPTVDNDLQKAIDDITKNTNTDPVFSDPVAAPSSVPEGDTGALAEPVGPFPEPLPPAPVEPEPIAPIPDLAAPVMDTPAPMPAPEEIAPIPANLDIHQIKEAALRDLLPLLDRLSMSPSQKFNLYRDIFENLRDYTVLAPAYNAAKEIPDDTERGEALLYLVESIDKM